MLDKPPLLFKSPSFIRGRSFQSSLIVIDECRNLTPLQIKTIVTRAGNGSRVICVGSLVQIDTHYPSATSSVLTYLREQFKSVSRGGNGLPRGLPRSALARCAEKQ